MQDIEGVSVGTLGISMYVYTKAQTHCNKHEKLIPLLGCSAI